MTTILAALLILSASGSAERSLVVADETIGRIVIQVTKGAAKDVIAGHDRIEASVSTERAWRALQGLDLRLRIDGRPRSGIRAWGEGLWRVGGFITDMRTDGEVGYSYSVRIRRFDITTGTRISDGSVTKTIDAWWIEVIVIPIPKGLRWLLGKQIVRRIPIHVQFIIGATECSLPITGYETNRSSTYVRLTGQAFGFADTRDFQCERVRFKHAEPEASVALDAGLRKALETIQREGTRFYHLGSADIGDTLDQIRPALQAALKMKMRLRLRR